MTLKEIESKYGVISKSRLTHEWRRRRYVNKNEVKYVLAHESNPRYPLLQAKSHRVGKAEHSTLAGDSWVDVKLSQVLPYELDEWEDAIRVELDRLGGAMADSLANDKRLIGEGVRQPISSFMTVSEVGKQEGRDIAWRIANIMDSGLH